MGRVVMTWAVGLLSHPFVRDLRGCMEDVGGPSRPMGPRSVLLILLLDYMVAMALTRYEVLRRAARPVLAILDVIYHGTSSQVTI